MIKISNYIEHFGKITDEGFCNLLDIITFLKNKKVDTRQIAYVLATIYHETAKTFKPIAEYGHGKGRPYGNPRPNGKIYYGRGYTQITWEENYSKFKKLIGIDLLGDPELALNHEVALKICYFGMTKGMFTGKKLSDYINDEKTDYVGARRIINGTDCASMIANYALKFNDLLK